MSDFRKVADSVDLVEVVERYNLEKFKIRGSGYSACCPFHKEKTPSFSLKPSTNRFKCFGCDESGSVIDFVAKIEGISLLQAMYKIADWYDIDVRKRPEMSEEDKRLTVIYGQTKQYFQDSLFVAIRKGLPVKEYIKSRGIVDKKFLYYAVRKFGMGYAPLEYKDTEDESKSFVLEDYYKKEYLLHSGVYIDNGPFFRDRLMFPISDRYGSTIAFTGRTIGETKYAKYMNSREHSQFVKENVWYAFHIAFDEIRKTQEVIIVEGQMDVLFMHYNGFGNTIGMSSSHISEVQAKLIARYSKKVILIPDGDAGPKKIKKQLQSLLKVGLDVTIMELEDGDPAEHLQKYGELQGEPKSVSQWIIENIKEETEAIELANSQKNEIIRYRYYSDLAIGLTLPMKIIEKMYKTI